MTIELTKQLIDGLSKLDLSKYPVDEVKTQLKGLRHFPFTYTEFHIGNVIYRIRPNSDGKSFEKPADLSYKPQEFNKTFQRASSPNQTMFYGSIIPQDNLETEIDIARVIAATEASRLFRDKNSGDGFELVTFGKWRVLDTIKLGTIVYSEIERNITPYVKNRGKALLEFMKGHPDKEEQGKVMMDFIASEFSKEKINADYDYIISALFTERIVEKGFDGVIYPSVRAEEKGMNVAISPSTVDSKMRLEGVMECKIHKTGTEILIEDSHVAWVNAGDTKLNFRTIKEDMEKRGVTIKSVLS